MKEWVYNPKMLYQKILDTSGNLVQTAIWSQEIGKNWGKFGKTYGRVPKNRKSLKKWYS
jgi:hypothetical protein